MILRKITLTAAVLTLALANVGCKKSNGGGFIESVVDGGNGKATLGYQLKCDNILHPSGEYVGHVTGNLQFNDHPADVKVHGNIDFIPYEVDDAFTSCEVIAAIIDGETPPYFDVAFGIGTYDKGGQSGELAFAPVVDPACPSGEGFIIDIIGDIDYFNSGCLGGGNLTIF